MPKTDKVVKDKTLAFKKMGNFCGTLAKSFWGWVQRTFQRFGKSKLPAYVEFAFTILVISFAFLFLVITVLGFGAQFFFDAIYTVADSYGFAKDTQSTVQNGLAIIGILTSAITIIILASSFYIDTKGLVENSNKSLAHYNARYIIRTASKKVKGNALKVKNSITYRKDSSAAGRGSIGPPIQVSFDDVLEEIKNIPDYTEENARKLFKISIFKVVFRIASVYLMLTILGTYLLVLIEALDFKVSFLVTTDAIFKGVAGDVLESFNASLDFDTVLETNQAMSIELLVRTLSSLLLIALIFSDIRLLLTQKKIRSKYIKELMREEFVFCCMLTRKYIAETMLGWSTRSDCSLSKNDYPIIEANVKKVKGFKFYFER